MEINRNNYEIYILDYIEGNLSSDIREDFELFFKKNPDLKSEIVEFETINLQPFTVNFHLKELLKKNPNLDIEGITKFEQLAISKLENDIQPNEIIALNELLANSENKQNEFLIFQRTKLLPDFSVKYQFKNDLKHKFPSIRTNVIYYISSIAASIAIIVGLAIFYNSSNSKMNGMALSKLSTIKKHEIISVQSSKIAFLYKETPENEKVQINQKAAVIDSMSVFYITSKQLVLNDESTNEVIDIENIANYNLKANQIADDKYFTLKDYLNKQFKVKILKQPVSDKITFTSVAKAFSRGLSRLFRKDIKLDEKVMEDGSTLYAFKAGAFEIYTNRPAKKTEPTINEKENENPDLQKIQN